MSADGNTAIVGGYLDNDGAGAAWVFARSGGVWTQQSNKLVGTSPTGTANQGWATALSTDGNTALVGGPADNNGAGAVWVFTRTGGVWAQQGTKLEGSSAAGPANQGWAVALSSDGNTALIGGPADNSGAGAVWVRGNHDDAAAGGRGIELFNPDGYEAMVWTREHIDDATRAFLAALPERETPQGSRFTLVHGGRRREAGQQRLRGRVGFHPVGRKVGAAGEQTGRVFAEHVSHHRRQRERDRGLHAADGPLLHAGDGHLAGQ